MGGKYAKGSAGEVHVLALFFDTPQEGFLAYQHMGELAQQGKLPAGIRFFHRSERGELNQAVVIATLPLDKNIDQLTDFLLQEFLERYNYRLFYSPRFTPAEAYSYATNTLIIPVHEEGWQEEE